MADDAGAPPPSDAAGDVEAHPAPSIDPTPPRSAGRVGWVRRRWRAVRENESQPAPRRYSFHAILRKTADHWRRPMSWVTAFGLTIIILGFLWQASHYWTAVIDDAYITFRFSDNLIHGHGLRFNPDGMKVEGYTNFLWMVLMAIPIGLGGDVMFAAKTLGLLAAILTIITACLFARNLRKRDDLINLLPAAFLAFNAHFAHWSLMGLETPLAVFLVFYAYYRFHKEVNDPSAWLISPWIATLAAMTRIDSLYYLSPLGLFGILLILLGRLRFRRMLTWALIAAVSFGAYFGWKILYFQDMAPNTYYAKQRLVTDETRTRGKAHIYEFYWNEDGAQRVKPLTNPRSEGKITAEMFLWYLRGGGSNAIWWINWWLASVLILLAFPRLANLLLILLPLGLNLYYVYHVDGDWMPNFRFFQTALPFLGVGAAVAIGLVQDFTPERLRWYRLPAYAYFVLCLVGLAAEQLHIGYVYVFHKEPMWMTRGAGWGTLAQAKSNYLGGFSPPLGPVSDWMLLNTVDGGSIFMSDIGQPLWYSTHLNLYDVDGLTDKYLAHAPSVRGADMKSVEEHLKAILEERRITKPGVKELESARKEAKRRDFEAHLDRNARYILEDVRPEYLLIFLNHDAGNPNSRGWPYPEISARVYNHPLREQNYEVMHRISKIGNVQNTFLRRKDVPAEIPDDIKVERLRRAIDRNPRFAYLVPLAFREMQKMADGPAREAARQLVFQNLGAIKDNPNAVRELTLAASSARDAEMSDRLFEMSSKASPKDPVLWRTRAETAWQLNNREEAIQHLENALKYVPSGDNSYHYLLAYYYEATGKYEDAARISRAAIKRNPDDYRAWSDLGTQAYRGSWAQNLTPTQVLERKRIALEGYEGMARLQKEQSGGNIKETVAKITAEIADLEKKASGE